MKLPKDATAAAAAGDENPASPAETKAASPSERKLKPLVPYVFIYGILFVGGLISISLPPMSQMAPSTPLFNLTAPMPLPRGCRDTPLPVNCSVVELEQTDPPLMHGIFSAGEAMGRRMWDIERNARDYEVLPQTRHWWKSVLADRVEEAPLVCLHLRHPNINIPARNISELIDVEHPAASSEDLCSRSDAYLQSRASRLSLMWLHGFNFQMVQQEHDFGARQISPLLFILLVASMFGQAGYIAQEYYRRRLEKRKYNPEPQNETFRKHFELPQQEADRQDERNIRILFLSIACLLLTVFPLDQTLHILQCYYKRHSLVETRFSGDASAMILLFHASSIASEYGMFIVQIASLVINIYRPSLRRDGTSESPLGHLVRLLGGVFANISAFCVEVYWIVRIQLEFDARPSVASSWDYWNVTTARPNFFSLDVVSDADVNLEAGWFLVFIRIMAPVLIILTVVVRLYYLVEEHHLWRAVTRGFTGATKEEISQIRALTRDFTEEDVPQASNGEPTDITKIGTTTDNASVTSVRSVPRAKRACPPDFLQIISPGASGRSLASPKPPSIHAVASASE